jgi:hypothetical protein
LGKHGTAAANRRQPGCRKPHQPAIRPAARFFTKSRVLDRQALIVWRRQSRFTIKPATRAVACRNASGDWAIGKDRPAKKPALLPRCLPRLRGPACLPGAPAGASNRHFRGRIDKP